MLSLSLNYLLEALFSITFTLGFSMSTYGFFRDRVQFVTRTKLECWDICGEKVLSHVSSVAGVGRAVGQGGMEGCWPGSSDGAGRDGQGVKACLYQ